MLNLSAMTPDRLKLAARVSDLDTALSLIMTAVDPKNEHDLGGEAGQWFSSDASEDWPRLEETDRERRLKDFFEHVQRQA